MLQANQRGSFVMPTCHPDINHTSLLSEANSPSTTLRHSSDHKSNEHTGIPITMRVFITLLLLAVATAFVVTTPPSKKTATKLDVTRRDILVTGILASIPTVAHASGSTFFYDEKIEQVREPSQMLTGDKLDLNSAFVGDYKQLPGMFPHAAGKIASHGPYKKVQDIYKIPDLTSNDIALFKKYESEFAVNPPGRTFYERINARVST